MFENITNTYYDGTKAITVDSDTFEELADSGVIRWAWDTECYHNDDDLVYIDSMMEFVTRDYAVEQFRYCDRCGNWVERDDFDFRHNMCNECANYYVRSADLIGGYHDHHYGGWSVTDKEGKGHTIGVELEIDNGEDRAELAETLDEIFGGRAYFEEDSSLSDDGFEIISEPCDLGTFYSMPWEAALEACENAGFESHDAGTCGLHIHVRRDFFGKTREERLANVGKFIKFYEHNVGLMITLSRRTGEQVDNWCKPGSYYWAERGSIEYEDYDGEFYDSNLTKKAEYALNYHTGHGTMLNFGNWNRESKTLEIRLGRGTLNYRTFRAWIDLNLTLVKNACKDITNDTTNPRVWFDGVEESTRCYINNRVGKAIL